MNLRDNIKNFLYDQKYIINIYEEEIYIFNYIYLPRFNENEIVVKIDDFKVLIKGGNLKITKMIDKELLIKGMINEVKIIR